MTTQWYIEGEGGKHHGPYDDWDTCCADAARLDGRIIEGDCDDEDDCDEGDFDNCDDVPASAECPNCHKTIHDGCAGIHARGLGNGPLCLCGCRMVVVALCECKDGFTCSACDEALSAFRPLQQARRGDGCNTDPAIAVLRKVRAAIRCNYDPRIIAREYGAEIDTALGGPDARGPLEDHPKDIRNGG